ncbi:MAG: cation diffusion facilitator family transporter [Deltaproteobacteria bacterium]|nr:MAG: cation diffusion facilitator family transporter [Deltaproteobacteria bacterium]
MASGRGAVVAAVFGNLFLATIKVVAFALSGSGAMLSEAIHSAADTGNQVLLYLGIRRSERPADAMFHYGYGAERFLFALLSAVGIFILGCGVTVYHGIHTLVDPPELRLSWVTVAVLAVSFCVDGAVFVTAVRAIAAAKGKKSFWQHIRTSSDPTVLAVLFEDFVATLGVVVAAVGIGLAHWTGNPMWDGISSIFIGLLLGAVAVWLGWRNRVLILGPAIPADVTAQAVAFLESQPAVEGVRAVKTRIVSADRFRLRADVDYNGRELGRRHAAWLRAQIAAGADPDTIAAEFGERVLDTLADEIQRIERELKQRVPQLRHIDFETDEFAG